MVTDVNQLLYAGSYVVSARLGLMDKKEGCATKNQWWERRLEESIEDWRKDPGRIDEIRKDNNVQQVVWDSLETACGEGNDSS